MENRKLVEKRLKLPGFIKDKKQADNIVSHYPDLLQSEEVQNIINGHVEDFYYITSQFPGLITEVTWIDEEVPEEKQGEDL